MFIIELIVFISCGLFVRFSFLIRKLFFMVFSLFFCVVVMVDVFVL